MAHSFRDLLQRGAVLFDGATGSLLYERGVFLNRCFEEVNLSQPDLVRGVHRDYAVAGAMVVETNTFGANRLALARHGVQEQCEAINRAGVRLCREAVGPDVLVAGSVGPTGVGAAVLTSGDDERARVHAAFVEQIGFLVDSGVDLLILETFRSLTELRLSLDAAHTVTSTLPVVAQLMFEQSGVAEDGSTPEETARVLAEGGADVVGANCGGGPQEIYEVVRRMVDRGRPVSAQANAGLPRSVEGRMLYLASPDYFAVFARRLLKLGVRVLGGCCGTRPAHIRAMAGAVRMFGHEWPPERDRPHVESARDATSRPAAAPARAMADKSALGRTLAAGRFAVSVEVNPPVGLDPTPAIEAARMLTSNGADVINIADGPRASVRMSNLALATLMQDRLGIEVILHVCCRDRNLLGLQAHLLGAWVLGIRNTVIITGDPPKMGDYPDATAVYDLDSIGLLRLIDGLNRGLDPAGRPMTEPTAFLCATGAEPGAPDRERELKRLGLKCDAGAEFIMTQPVYDPAVMVRFLDDVDRLGLGRPVLMGLLPLASHRNAEFLHHNVPGMQVPEDIRERMRRAGSGAPARAEGVKIAREALEVVRPRIAGAYIMPPLGRYDMALEVIDGFI